MINYMYVKSIIQYSYCFVNTKTSTFICFVCSVLLYFCIINLNLYSINVTVQIERRYTVMKFDGLIIKTVSHKYEEV